MHPSRFILGFAAGSVLWMFPALAFCQDAKTRILVQSLGSEEFKDRVKAQRDLVEWAQGQPDRAEDWLLREHDAAVEAEIRLRLRETLRELVIAEHQKDGKGYVGIRMGDVEVMVPGEAELRGGVRINWVGPDTPASRAQLKIGDVIVALDQHRWDRPNAVEAFAEQVRKYKPGATVNLEILRAGELKKIPVTLAARPMGLPEVQNLVWPNGVEPEADLKVLQKQAEEEFFERWLAKKRAGDGKR
jgi:membrane-associated protease RseP (regulator of RpoE activity)